MSDPEPAPAARSGPAPAVRVAVLQATAVVGATAANLAVIEAAARRAAALGCRMLVTPELFTSGYAPLEVADDDGGAQRTALAAIAAATGLAVVASTVEQTGSGQHGTTRHITASLFDDAGLEVTRYRKQRLFGPDELSCFTPGGLAPEVVDVDGVAVALGICFDVEFPEFARGVASRGAELLAVPTAVPVRAAGHPFDVRRVPMLLVPARALENGLYVAYAGHHGPRFAGLSSVTDPFGVQVALAGEDAPALLVAEVSAAVVRSARLDTPYLDISRTPVALGRPWTS